ncbi:transposase (plasmid) [Bacillus carboniphilus]|uniref:Transposase n=1 Tax=Bacillus carboniphilus TaxID=86663 RepID=A0ABY9K0N5_9BACI|nr:RNA-guided endonuclease TnpB family protein [Bacillus carboniphilus]WLR44402.1 transposase [Bacillus carboniphilus]
MLLTAKIKIVPDAEQHQYLVETMHCFNKACNRISEIAFQNKTFSKVKIQKLCYYEIRNEFKLSAQLVIRAIAKVAEAYKVSKKTKCTFRSTGAVVYDQRVLSFKGLESASISTLYGRINVPMVVSPYHQKVMKGQKIRGQADLIFVDSKFYLMLVFETPDTLLKETEKVLGIDLGIANIAVDSDQQIFSGKKINRLRKRYARIRKKLQAKGTKSAKRKLKQRSKKEKRMVKDMNHQMSKKIVEKASRHCSAIALEDLKNISKLKEKKNRKTVSKSQRTLLSNWSFYQLRQFIEYKSQKAGVPVLFVDPSYTSQTCSECGHTDKENRKSQSEFICTSCGYVAHADYNASLNIREKGYRQLAERRSA